MLAVQEDFVLVLDSDMVLRKPFLVEVAKPKKGSAVGARYTYMIGVANELADRHIPEIPKRNDTRAGPYGRRADQVRRHRDCQGELRAGLNLIAWRIAGWRFLLHAPR